MKRFRIALEEGGSWLSAIKQADIIAKWLRALLALASVATALSVSTPVMAAPFCRYGTLNATVTRAAHDQLSLGELQTLAKRFDTEAASCESRVPYCVGLKVALMYVDRAFDRLGQAPPDLSGARNELDAGRRNGAPWQLLATLGDVEASTARELSNGDLYRDAARDLQLSLNAINEPAICPDFGETRPPTADTARIRKRALEAVMLAPRFEVARTRSGDCGGIFLSKVRGIAVESVPLPITFPTNSAELTPEGRKAAEMLLQCVREKQMSVVVLTGHTDVHGSDVFNMDLSARRLHTVGDFMKAGGFSGTLKLIPKGKRDLFKPDDPAQHSEAELDQMNRRVELREPER